jgi:hypothetical protein
VVREEQPIRKRVVLRLSLDDSTLKVAKYPRETRYYSFGPAYSLRPQSGSLLELSDEIGRS